MELIPILVTKTEPFPDRGPAGALPEQNKSAEDTQFAAFVNSSEPQKKENPGVEAGEEKQSQKDEAECLAHAAAEPLAEETQERDAPDARNGDVKQVLETESLTRASGENDATLFKPMTAGEESRQEASKRHPIRGIEMAVTARLEPDFKGAKATVRGQAMSKGPGPAKKTAERPEPYLHSAQAQLPDELVFKAMDQSSAVLAKYAVAGSNRKEALPNARAITVSVDPFEIEKRASVPDIESDHLGLKSDVIFADHTSPKKLSVQATEPVSKTGPVMRKHVASSSVSPAQEGEPQNAVPNAGASTVSVDPSGMEKRIPESAASGDQKELKTDEPLADHASPKWLPAQVTEPISKTGPVMGKHVASSSVLPAQDRKPQSAAPELTITDAKTKSVSAQTLSGTATVRAAQTPVTVLMQANVDRPQTSPRTRARELVPEQVAPTVQKAVVSGSNRALTTFTVQPARTTHAAAYRGTAPESKPDLASEPETSPVGGETRITAQVSTAMNSATRSTDMINHIARQLAEALPTKADRPIDVTLNPEELGRVRMTLKADGGMVTLHIAAERPETLDLMRRHIDHLGDSFGDLGFEDMAFSFGHSNADDPQSKEDSTTLTLTGGSPLLIEEDASPVHVNATTIRETGLDIRF